MGNAVIRDLLKAKLGIERAQLYKIAGGVADQLSISVADAILALAAKNHINLAKHAKNLSPEKLAQIRSYLPHLQNAHPDVPTHAVVSSSGRGRAKPRPKKVFNVKTENPENDPVIDPNVLPDAESMVQVYRLLYLLENSIRQFLTKVLSIKHGNNWWEETATGPLKKQVEERTKDDQINAWHQKRSKNPIDYLDLNRLPAIVRNNQEDFVDEFFVTVEWFQHFIDQVYRSRCVICHMNPLTQTNIEDVAVHFNHWQNLIRAKADQLANLKPLPTPAPVVVAARVPAAVSTPPAPETS